MTNGDRIRRMTNGEISEMLVFIDKCSMCTGADSVHCGEPDFCKRSIEEWLEQESNMSEQMTRQEAIETLETFKNDYTREGSAICRAIDSAINVLRQHTPKSEVPHGHWIECCNELDKKCSHCDKVHGTIYEKELFCPNCGAIMDGEVECE